MSDLDLHHPDPTAPAATVASCPGADRTMPAAAPARGHDLASLARAWPGATWVTGREAGPYAYVGTVKDRRVEVYRCDGLGWYARVDGSHPLQSEGPRRRAVTAVRALRRMVEVPRG